MCKDTEKEILYARKTIIYSRNTNNLIGVDYKSSILDSFQRFCASSRKFVQVCVKPA